MAASNAAISQYDRIMRRYRMMLSVQGRIIAWNVNIVPKWLSFGLLPSFNTHPCTVVIISDIKLLAFLWVAQDSVLLFMCAGNRNVSSDNTS